MLMKRTPPGGMRHSGCSVAFLLALLTVAGHADASVTVHALGNLTAGSCNIVLDTRDDKLQMRGVLASEFDTQQTASIMPFQMIVENCNGTQVGGTFDVTVSGKTLTTGANVFNDNSAEDVGFMLKENGNATPNYWAGTLQDYYAAAGTVVPGIPTQTTVLQEADPLSTRLNYFLGFVTPKMGGGVDATPRHVTATIEFNVNYH